VTDQDGAQLRAVFVRLRTKSRYFTVIDTAADGMPFATTSSALAPVSRFGGTSKFVDTGVLPVATPIML
jgi:hypothetical protein